MEKINDTSTADNHLKNVDALAQDSFYTERSPFSTRQFRAAIELDRTLRVSCLHSLPCFTLNIELLLNLEGITAIVGPSGAGKTTFLRFLAGLEKMDGCCHIGSQVWQHDDVNLPSHKRSVGYVFQQSALFPFLNVEQNILYGYRRGSADRNSSLVEDTIRLLKLEDLLKRGVQRLSAGEKQRVAIARAILYQPKLLLLDEPLASVDNAHRFEIIEFIKSIRHQLQIPIIYVSHNIEEVAALADYVVFLNEGKVASQGGIEDVAHLLYENMYSNSSVLSHGALFSFFSGKSYKEKERLVVKISSKTLYLPRTESCVEGDIRVRVYANNVGISLVKPEGTSILNNLMCEVRAIEKNQRTGQTLVTLNWGSNILYSYISNYSASVLNLHLDDTVYAQVKAATVMTK